MKVKYIRRDTPAEFSEEGGSYIQLVGKTTIGLTSSIKEAIHGLYCTGEASLIEGYFVGLMRSVFAGIKADGCSRCVGDIRFYAVCGGAFDLTKGWDPLVNDVRIKAQLLNGVTLDITDWSFEDVTEGRVSFSLTSLESEAGATGVVVSGKKVAINGKNLPAHDDLALSWECNDKSGAIAAASFTSTCTRIDIAKDALGELTAEDDGKEIVFTVKGCYNKATIKGVFTYAEQVPALTKVQQGNRAAGTAGFGQGAENAITLTGVIPGGKQAGDKLTLHLLAEDGSTVTEMDATRYVTASDDDSLTLGNGIDNDSAKSDGDWQDKSAKFVLTRDGKDYPLTFKFLNA